MAGHDVHPQDMENDPTIAAFALDLQDAASATPAPAVGASLAAVLDGRVPTDVYPEVVLPGQLRRGQRSLRLRWAVASAAFGIGAGSLGVAGALPGPVQRQVARMAEVVGVDLPDGRPTTTTTVTRPPVTVPASTSVPQRPTVVPADERPVPSTVPDDPSNRGNREGRGRGDELGGGASPARDDDRSGPSDAEDELGEVVDDDELDEDRSGPSDAEDELGEDRGEDEDDEKSDEDRTGHGADDADEDEGREP